MSIFRSRAGSLICALCGIAVVSHHCMAPGAAASGSNRAADSPTSIQFSTASSVSGTVIALDLVRAAAVVYETTLGDYHEAIEPETIRYQQT